MIELTIGEKMAISLCIKMAEEHLLSVQKQFKTIKEASELATFFETLDCVKGKLK